MPVDPSGSWQGPIVTTCCECSSSSSSSESTETQGCCADQLGTQSVTITFSNGDLGTCDCLNGTVVTVPYVSPGYYVGVGGSSGGACNAISNVILACDYQRQLWSIDIWCGNVNHGSTGPVMAATCSPFSIQHRVQFTTTGEIQCCSGFVDITVTL